EQLVEKLLAAVEIPVPAGLVAAEVDAHLKGEAREGDDAHRAEVVAETSDNIRKQILLDVLAEKLDIKVGQGELVDFLVQTSRQYGMEPQQFIETLDASGRIPSMVAELARNKSLAVALRQIVVKDTKGKVVDLSEFIGSDEADDAQRAVAEAASQALAAEADGE
ncbi:MAG: trigger factor, partial [Promicromonosporaceae bacterium]|nr:trigger factor [Promicromonosporaceae bacterium]